MDAITERKSAFILVEFKDENGAAVQPTSGTYRLDDADRGVPIVDTAALSITGTSLTLEITPDHNTIRDPSSILETRRVFAIWIYGTPAKQGSAEYLYQIRNCSGVYK